MSAFGAKFFRWVQSAGFYQEFHAQAVASLEAPPGTDWLDVGCGPGLLCRIAASQGFRVIGTDLNPEMITLARTLTKPAGPAYEVRSLDALLAESRRASIVSASSLLVVLADPEAGFNQLRQLVAAGGSLLVIEASSRFGWFAGLKYIFRYPQMRGRGQFLLWLLVRSYRTLDAALFEKSGMDFRKLDLMDGLISAWIIRPGFREPSGKEKFL